MDKKTTGIVAYLTWIGLVIAFVAGDKEGAKFHLNQALGYTAVQPVKRDPVYRMALGYFYDCLLGYGTDCRY